MSCPRFPNLGEILQSDMVGKIRKGIVSKVFLNCDCKCKSTNKVKGTCACGGECRACCVVYKVVWRLCLIVYMVNTQNSLKNKMEEHFQEVAQRVHHDKNSDTFVAHYAQPFDQKPTPQQYREIMKFNIFSTVNPIGMIKPGVMYIMHER